MSCSEGKNFKRACCSMLRLTEFKIVAKSSRGSSVKLHQDRNLVGWTGLATWEGIVSRKSLPNLGRETRPETRDQREARGGFSLQIAEVLDPMLGWIQPHPCCYTMSKVGLGSTCRFF